MGKSDPNLQPHTTPLQNPIHVIPTPKTKSRKASPNTKVPAKPTLKQKPKPDPKTTPDPKPSTPEEYPRMPGVKSLVRFGTIGGSPVIWEVSAKTNTTLTMFALQDISALADVLSAAEQATILATTGGLRPAITLDGTKLNFEFRGNYCYAEPR
jgi:hypothetical protein